MSRVEKNQVAGVYAIFCVPNGKFYVGSSFDMASRFTRHKYELNNKFHYNRYLQNAWNKYGAESFCFFPLEECSKDTRLDVEQKWIDKLKSHDKKHGFNEVPQAHCTSGYKHTEEYKLKKSKAWILTKPDGEEINAVNLKQFCRDHDLSFQHMGQVAKGLRSASRGWRCRREGTTLEDWQKLRTGIKKTPEQRSSAKNWVCIGPDGISYSTKNLSRFCIDNGLSEDMMRRVAHSGRSHRGWTCSVVAQC